MNRTMTWDRVIGLAIMPLLEADSQLTDELGGVHIYAQEASRPIVVPSVVWDLLSDELTELFNPIDTQWDYFARNRESAVVIERRLRALLHRDTRRVLAGINLSTVYQDSFTHDYPDPGVVHRSLRFRFEAPRGTETTEYS